jgi:glycosyltransferase involved in cell wall biosynthesis
MIVKNESKIIARLLESVAPWIDSYCICDTGSTDNTIEIIQTFFESRQIPGRIFQEPFRDFGYNRSFALKECDKMGPLAEYALLLDADMVFWASPTVTKQNLKQIISQQQAMCILQGTDQFNYRNIRIVKCGIGASYWGVTHEYVQLPPGVDGSATLAKQEVFIRDIGDGGAKADKFERDIRLLKQGLVDVPDNCRYTFYLANSLRDHGDTEEAIATYEKRIALGGWEEELWYSYFSMGMCYMRLNNPQRAIVSWLEGTQCFPERIENLYEIMNYYRSNCKYVLAQKFYAMARAQLQQTPYEQKSFLFMHRDVYDYKLDYEMTVAGYYCNPDRLDLGKLSMKVLSYPSLPGPVQQNVLLNYKYYAKPLDTTTTSAFFTPAFFNAMEFPVLDDPSFVASTPSMVKMRDGKICFVIRYVNYRIHPETGSYINRDKVESRNWIMTLENVDDKWSMVRGGGRFLDHDRTYDGYYVGVEDVRLWLSGSDLSSSGLKYNGNRGVSGDRMVIETGSVVNTLLKKEYHLTTSSNRQVEKNWVMVTDTHMVYQWHPLTIIHLTGGKAPLTHPTPAWFQHVRGSSNAVAMGDELWFLCHVVSYEKRRYYYHLVIMLDAKTFELRRYTRLFTFEQQPVEYALGFMYESSFDEFLIGYSVMDRRTEFRVTKRQTLVDLCI